MPSLDALGQAVLDALAANDRSRLEELALDELEFTTVVWPELPSSRPERGVPLDYAWNDLHQKSTNSLRRVFLRYGGRPRTLVTIGFTDETTAYETFVVHRDSVLTFRDEAGVEHTSPLFGAVLQRGNEFKVFSFVID